MSPSSWYRLEKEVRKKGGKEGCASIPVGSTEAVVGYDSFDGTYYGNAFLSSYAFPIQKLSLKIGMRCSLPIWMMQGRNES